MITVYFLPTHSHNRSESDSFAEQSVNLPIACNGKFSFSNHPAKLKDFSCADPARFSVEMLEQDMNGPAPAVYGRQKHEILASICV